jgi:hypothetical protein
MFSLVAVSAVLPNKKANEDLKRDNYFSQVGMQLGTPSIFPSPL